MTPEVLNKGCFAFVPTQTALPVGLTGDHPFPRPTELPRLAGSSQEVGPSVGADIIKCNAACGSSAPHHNQL